MSLSYPDAGVALFYPTHAHTVDVSSVDFDATTAAVFPLGFFTQIYVGTSSAGTIAVLYVGDTVAVTHKNVLQGTYLKGAFAKILHTGTSASDLIALGF